MPPTTPQGFALGFLPARSAVAHAQLIASQKFARVAQGQESLPAISLSQYLLRAMTQGSAGTCWEHSAVCLAETTANALGYQIFEICRRLVGYVGKSFEGGGNQADGGSPLDALHAMTGDRGVGIAHESLCPYTDNRAVLSQKPPQAVYDDAEPHMLTIPVDVQSDDDAMVMITNLHCVQIGTWWPYNFDEGKAIMTSIGNGTYGHALTKIGYVKPGVIDYPGLKDGAFQWRNWHGQLYPPLPPSVAEKIPGYKADNPTTTSDFWVPFSLDRQLQGKGNYEYSSATDYSGLDRNMVVTNFDGSFV